VIGQTPPPLQNDHALFLDFDGTLVDIAPAPDRIVVAPGLTQALARLLRPLGGALALISGRPIAEIDHWLAPLQLPVAGIHGAERRDGAGRLSQHASDSLAGIVAVAEALAGAHPGLRVERKRSAVALHYREAPHCEGVCREAMQAALATAPELALLPGKCVFEVLPRGISKGASVLAFMQEAPFRGRRPVFIGDDVTDEAGFEAVREHGGIAVKVGSGPSVADYRLADAAQVRRWLFDAAAAIGAAGAHGGRTQDATDT
jgi:trehalose 6-phosphate phosphatase